MLQLNGKLMDAGYEIEMITAWARQQISRLWNLYSLRIVFTNIFILLQQIKLLRCLLPASFFVGCRNKYRPILIWINYQNNEQCSNGQKPPKNAPWPKKWATLLNIASKIQWEKKCQHN